MNCRLGSIFRISSRYRSATTISSWSQDAWAASDSIRLKHTTLPSPDRKSPYRSNHACRYSRWPLDKGAGTLGPLVLRPLGRIGHIEGIVYSVPFQVSDESSFTADIGLVWEDPTRSVLLLEAEPDSYLVNKFLKECHVTPSAARGPGRWVQASLRGARPQLPRRFAPRSDNFEARPIRLEVYLRV